MCVWNGGNGLKATEGEGLLSSTVVLKKEGKHCTTEVCTEVFSVSYEKVF